jgi:hypothetical protein
MFRIGELIRRLTPDTIPMSFMNRDESRDAPDPWDESPFEQLNSLRGVPSEEIQSLVRQNAEKIRSEVARSGAIESDEAVVGAMDRQRNTPNTQATIYYRRAGPVADSAEGVRLTGVFRLESDAPLFKSEAWFEAAEALDIPDTDRYELVLEAVTAYYSALESRRDKHERIDAFHPEKLKRIGPALRERQYDRAFDYLGSLPGVVVPDESGLAWEAVEPKTEVTETPAESHGD